MTAALLDIHGLTLRVARTDVTVARDVALKVGPGEVVAIVGESGSGKTLVARSILGLAPPAIRRVSGSILFEGWDMATADASNMRALRGARIGMVFQEPMTSLNPALTIGQQMSEGLRLHLALDADACHKRMVGMLRRIGITDPETALRAYPHQFSGGMRQRIMLASVMLLKPALLIADEPTTALDAVVQREVLELMMELTRANNTAVLMISHDLAMVARYAHRIVVMRKGDVVETGMVPEILERPQEAYTKALLAAMPRRLPARRMDRNSVPIISVRDLVVEYPGKRGFFRSEAPMRVLHGINLEVHPSEVVALVGGSGSGKTTLGRTIAGLLQPADGSIAFRGQSLGRAAAARRDYRLNCQMVFQDPYSSLDPRMKVRQLVGEALRHAPELARRAREARIAEVLEEVGLGAPFLDRFPHELSGGQRQRIAIARAIVRRPAFVIADEPVSALDVTVRAQVLELFADLQKRHGFSCLFISHDLGVVEQISDRVVVMQEGRIVEQGSRDSVFDHPRHPYTRKLLSAIPALVPGEKGGVRLKWFFDQDKDGHTTASDHRQPWPNRIDSRDRAGA